MLAHPARCAAGARRIDDAGQILALELSAGGGGFGRGRMVGDEFRPVVEIERPRLPDLQVLHADDVVQVIGMQRRGQQHAR